MADGGYPLRNAVFRERRDLVRIQQRRPWKTQARHSPPPLPSPPPPPDVRWMSWCRGLIDLFAGNAGDLRVRFLPLGGVVLQGSRTFPATWFGRRVDLLPSFSLPQLFLLFLHHVQRTSAVKSAGISIRTATKIKVSVSYSFCLPHWLPDCLPLICLDVNLIIRWSIHLSVFLSTWR